MTFPGPQMMREVSYLILECFFLEPCFMVSAQPIPAEWQGLASWVQLNVCDSLFQEYNYRSSYPK